MSIVTLQSLTTGSSLELLEPAFSALTFPESRVVTEGQKTAIKFERFVGAMQERFTVLSQENRRLREQLVTCGARERETTLLHRSELIAAQKNIDAARQEVFSVRQEMAQVVGRAETRAAETIETKVQAVTRAADERIATLQHELVILRHEKETLREEHSRQAATSLVERNVAVQAVTQTALAQARASQQEVETIRQEVSRLKEVEKRLSADVAASEARRKKQILTIKTFISREIGPDVYEIIVGNADQ